MKHLRAFLACAALALAGCGEGDWPEPAPALWRVTSPDGDKGWLLGTVHALPDGVEWRTPLLDQAFADADLLVVEIADLDNTELSFPIFQRLAYSQGLPALTMRVAGPDRAKVTALLQRASGDEGDFAEMESWAAAMVLAGGVRLGDPANGVDQQLLAAGKPVVGLESFASQLAIFDQLPDAEQQDLLLAVAQEAAVDDPRAGLEAWLVGDLAALEALGGEGLLADPELRAALLDGRNRAWIDRVAALVDGGEQPFVAVGAAHMLGDAGLPALLAARGFTVERLQ